MILKRFLPSVRTCTGERFIDECLKLRADIDARLRPDLVLGVMTGGGVIVNTMIERGGEWHPHGYVSAARGSTKVKKGHLGSFIKRIPRVAANVLRVVEHIGRETCFYVRPAAAERHVVMDPAIVAMIQRAHRICVVDDAIDSGSTLIYLRGAIKAINPDASIFFAAVTQTFLEPLIKPDVVRFERTLVRFPWAIDAANEI